MSISLHMVWEVSAHGIHWRTFGIAWYYNEGKSLVLEADQFPEENGSEESILPASILAEDKYSMYPLFTGASNWKPTLAQTLLCTRNNKTAEDGHILTRALVQTFLKYAINVAKQGSWLKLWDITLDYGAECTRQALSILQALTTPCTVC